MSFFSDSMVFYNDLSPTLSDKPENKSGILPNNMEVDFIQATDDLNYLKNQIKEGKKSKYYLKRVIKK